MRAAMIVVLVAVVLSAGFIGLWLWDRDPERLARRRSGTRSSSALTPPPPESRGIPQARHAAPLTTSDIAWAVCAGLWLFLVTLAAAGVLVGLVVGIALCERG